MELGEWLALGAFLIGLFGALFGVWRFLDGKIGRVDTKADTVARDLAAHRLHVSDNYATKAGVTEAIKSVAEQNVHTIKAVTDMGDRIDKRLDGMTERLDRVIEANHRPIRRHTDR